MFKKKYVGYRPTWAEVDLDNLAYNYRQIKKALAPKIKIMVIVKADAYGHGLVPVSKKLEACGVNYLGVASIDEGIKLREAKVNTPILVLGIMLTNDILPLFNYNLIPTVCTEEYALALNNLARRLGKPMKVHIKIDTGMSRLGVLNRDALSFIRRIHSLKFIHIEGIFTHLACADINRDFTLYQIRLMDDLIFKLAKAGIKIPLVHTANSIGTTNYKESHFNLVRPGLIIYGLYPKEGMDIKLKPVLSLKTMVVYLKRVPKGQGISYGHTYITKKDTTIVNLPIGYGDGYPRSLSNQAEVLIRGKRFKISGRVCMDQVMVDVGDNPVKIADEVVLIGRQGKNMISAEELAEISGTIPYEVVCGLGSRIPRIYQDRVS
ncbi:alanine racemase [bacterium]|nr:MAG: alanine racemase [bacterium]